MNGFSTLVSWKIRSIQMALHDFSAENSCAAFFIDHSFEQSAHIRAKRWRAQP
jgi:hypothetical protein